MTGEAAGFEMAEDGAAAGAPDLKTPVTPQGPPAPSPGRGAGGPPGRPEGGPARPAYGGLRRLMYALGFALTTVLLFLWLNPASGFVRSWPWEMFLARGEDGNSSVRFAWAPNHALAIELTLAAAGLLVAAVLPAGRGRGLLGLGVAALAFATFYFREEGVVLDAFAVTAAVGPLLAGALALAAGRAPGAGSGGARILLAAGLLVVGLGAFVPYPLRSAAGEDSDTEPPEPASAAVELFEDLFADDADQTPLDTLTDPPGVWMVALLGVAAAGLLALLGLGGRWAAPTALGFAVLLALGTHVSTLWHATHPDEGSRMAADLHAGMRDVASALRYGYYPFFLPLGAAILDLALGRRPRA